MFPEPPRGVTSHDRIQPPSTCSSIQVSAISAVTSERNCKAQTRLPSGTLEDSHRLERDRLLQARELILVPQIGSKTCGQRPDHRILGPSGLARPPASRHTRDPSQHGTPGRLSDELSAEADAEHACGRRSSGPAPRVHGPSTVWRRARQGYPCPRRSSRRRTCPRGSAATPARNCAHPRHCRAPRCGGERSRRNVTLMDQGEDAHHRIRSIDPN